MSAQAEAPRMLKHAEVLLAPRNADAKEMVIALGEISTVVGPCRAPVPGHCTQRCHIGEVKSAK